jgi:hypothetical protein
MGRIGRPTLFKKREPARSHPFCPGPFGKDQREKRADRGMPDLDIIFAKAQVDEALNI